MKCEDRARRWLADWVPGHGEAAVKALTHEFAVAQAEALLEGLKAAEEPPPDVPHEPWPNRHNTPTGQPWFRSE
jgi:hypothetical protein